ncbi:MAG: hypothetical protein AABZ33_05545 [Chloroflexota bacterium]
MPIAEARALPNGTAATIVGVLTTALDALEDGRSAFVEDATGGIALYLSETATEGWPAGTLVRAAGTIDDRYAQRTLRVALADVVALGSTVLPDPIARATGELGEAGEGRRTRVAGVTVGASTSYADGTGVLIDDGTGPARAIILPVALGGRLIPSGARVDAIGPLGQRDSSGTETAGYRLYVARPDDLVVEAPSPSPSPSATPGPTSAPTPSPSSSATSAPTPAPTAAPTPVPTVTPAPTATPISIAIARTLPIGNAVTVLGVVLAEPGRLGLPPLSVIADDTGVGIVIRLADGMTGPPRGTRVIVTGRLADPYGQLELRLSTGGLGVLGTATLPDPFEVTAVDLGERTEGRLVAIDGVVVAAPTRATSGDLSIALDDDSGARFRVMADASAGIDPARLPAGARVRVTGVVGQRASRKDALDGYRIWVRDSRDVVALDGVPAQGTSAGPGDGASGDGAGADGVPTIAIVEALRRGEGEATLRGVVTIGPLLLDATGRRIVIDDGTAAIEVLLPASEPAPRIGSLVRAGGELGLAYGAPRLRATTLAVLGVGAAPAPLALTGAPTAAVEWRVVRASGTILEVVRLGDRWRAELLVNGVRVAVVGQAGSGIPSTALVKGRRATIVGIVRRPYPTATDRRFAIVPRLSTDVALGPGEPGSTSAGSAGRSAVSRGITASRGGNAGRSAVDAPPAVPVVDLGGLSDWMDRLVRVGGIVVRSTDGLVDIDDGTAVATIRLEGAARELAGFLERGDAINVVGTVVPLGDGKLGISVDDPGGVARIGSLGQPVALASGTGADTRGGGAHTAAGADHNETPGDARPLSLAAALGLAPDGALGVAGAVLITLLSLGVALVRREVARRRLAVRVAARLAAVADMPGRVP